MHEVYLLGVAARRIAETMEKRAMYISVLTWILFGVIVPLVLKSVCPELKPQSIWYLFFWVFFVFSNPLHRHSFELRLVEREATIYGLFASPKRCNEMQQNLRSRYHAAIRGTILGVNIDRRVFNENNLEVEFFTHDDDDS